METRVTFYYTVVQALSLNIRTWVDDWFRTCSFAALDSLSFDRQLNYNDLLQVRMKRSISTHANK
jgi:hypothetical protein